MIPVSYLRGGGSRAPREDEHLDLLPDGTCQVWRTVATRRVGRFAPQLDEPTGVALEAAITAAMEEGPFGLPPGPGAAEETVVLGGEDEEPVEAVLPSSAEPGGPWGELLGVLRQLVDRAIEHPVAAVELMMSPNVDTLTLRHAGTEALDLSDGPMSIEVVPIDADGSGDGGWSVEIPTPAGCLGTGWSAEVPLEHPLTPPPGGRLAVLCRLAVLTDGYAKSVAVHAAERPAS